MEIIIGLLIIAAGSFCQSSSYVPIKKVRDWSWESFWLVQGVFAWLVFPLLGAMLAVPSGHTLIEAYSANPTDALLAVLFGVLWGVGGLTFGLSMRYLGVALGQSISLGTCAGLGTILTPLIMGKPGELTVPGNCRCGGDADRDCHYRCGREHEGKNSRRACQRLQFRQRDNRRTDCRTYECLFQHRSRLRLIALL